MNNLFTGNFFKTLVFNFQLLNILTFSKQIKNKLKTWCKSLHTTIPLFIEIWWGLEDTSPPKRTFYQGNAYWLKYIVCHTYLCLNKISIGLNFKGWVDFLTSNNWANFDMSLNQLIQPKKFDIWMMLLCFLFFFFCFFVCLISVDFLMESLQTYLAVMIPLRFWKIVAGKKFLKNLKKKKSLIYLQTNIDTQLDQQNSQTAHVPPSSNNSDSTEGRAGEDVQPLSGSSSWNSSNGSQRQTQEPDVDVQVMPE